MTGVALGFMLQTALLAAGPQTYAEAFNRTQTNGQPLLVLVGADWCPGCRTMKGAVIPQMQRGGKLRSVNFASINTDESSVLASRLMRGGSIPQLIVFAKTEKGWHREQITGAASEAAVEQLLRRASAAQIAAKTAKEKGIASAATGQ